jgi:hypothetical protein
MAVVAIMRRMLKITPMNLTRAFLIFFMPDADTPKNPTGRGTRILHPQHTP